jgi:hypothetical protein
VAPYHSGVSMIKSNQKFWLLIKEECHARSPLAMSLQLFSTFSARHHVAPYHSSVSVIKSNQKIWPILLYEEFKIHMHWFTKITLPMT